VFGRRCVVKLHALNRWRIVCQWYPERGRFFDIRRRALFARENVFAAASRVRWWTLGWTAGWIQRPSTRQGKLFHELSATAAATYRPAPYDQDLVLVRGSEFGGVDWAARRAEPDMSWHRATSGRIEIVRVSGTHVSILEGETARELGDVLARAVQSRATAGDALESEFGSPAITVADGEGRSAATR
jgi:hypothetical protein